MSASQSAAPATTSTARLTPVTELDNALSTNIDEADGKGMLDILRLVDAELFAGWTRPHSPESAAHKDVLVEEASGTVFDDPLLADLSRLCRRVFALLRTHGRGLRVVFSGCGTSGRIGFYVARMLNAMVNGSTENPLRTDDDHAIFRYLISGGDDALLLSDELPEDDPGCGARDLAQCIQGAEHVVFVGITCGLSAPYVAGQLDYCMDLAAGVVRDDGTVQAQAQSTVKSVTTVMMGFNPVSLARQTPIELWAGRNFYQVARRLEALRDTYRGRHAKDSSRAVEEAKEDEEKAATAEKSEKATPSQAGPTEAEEDLAAPAYFILNPIVGPEAITGSSRMKGGSMTKILLEATFAPALHALVSSQPDAMASDASARQRVLDRLRAYEKTYFATYQKLGPLGRVVTAAGSSLRSDGHIYYLSADPDVGVMAFLDGSEMPDTYGTPHTDVRAFIDGGWKTMANAGGDLTSHDELFHITLAEFRERVLPSVSAADTVIVLSASALRDQDMGEAGIVSLARDCAQRSATVAWVEFFEEARGAATAGRYDYAAGDARLLQHVSEHVLVPLPAFDVEPYDRTLLSMSAKWVLNGITTAANVRNGAVLRNRMINLTVANNKLYHRAIGIIRGFAPVDVRDGETALLRAIYEIDAGPADLQQSGALSAARLAALRQRPLSEHIIRSTEQLRVLPLAILLAATDLSAPVAAQRLRADGGLRHIIAEATRK